MQRFGKHWWVTAIVVAVLFGFFVWPTPYEVSRYKGETFRVNRFSGVREMSTSSGWVKEDWTPD